MRFEALWSFHQRCIQTASKESKSKNKCIIEFTLHTWMKYLFFLIPHEKCRLIAEVHMCLCVSEAVMLPAAARWMCDKNESVWQSIP